jgi:hypothetical protein
MSGVSLPVTRPVGRALLVGSAASRAETVAMLERVGLASIEVDDPYAAMAELCRRPLSYRALILSLGSMYREELPLIAVIKRRYPHIEIWLAQTDGRAAALADAMRLGADGLLGDDGLHRVAVPDSPPADIGHDFAPGYEPMARQSHLSHDSELASEAESADAQLEHSLTEPVLTAEELRALLHETPTAPPIGEE